jgi:hypothetical protein
MTYLRLFATTAGLLAWLPEVAAGCRCADITPQEGFDRAQYVFTGTVAVAERHTWVVEPDRIWKGSLPRSVRLMDVYAAIDCEFFFERGKRYLFFAIRAKSGAHVFYHPQVCNLTSPVQSKRIATADGKSPWLEELIAKEHGPGKSPE